MNTKRTWWQRLRTQWHRFKAWLVLRLICKLNKLGIVLEVEARHGAFRTRHRELWKGGLIRVNIPLQQQKGHTDTPMGRISTDEAKKLIDAFTGVEGEDAFQEVRPGRDKFERIDGVKPVCAACGQELKRRLPWS